MKKLCKLTACTGIILCLTACGVVQPEPTTEPEIIDSVAMVVDAETIRQLDDYPDLKTADLTGSTCYDEIRSYVSAHPAVDVIYTVSLGGGEVASGEMELTLPEGSFGYEELMQKLSYLPELRQLTLPETSLTAEQIGAIREQYPALDLQYSVKLLDALYACNAESLNLAGLTEEALPGVLEQLKLFPDALTVELMDENDQCALTLDEVCAIQQLLPGALIHYSFDLFDQRISTTDEVIEYKYKKIGNEGEPQIRQALDICRGCRKFILNECRIDNEILASIREDYRDRTKVVWHIHFGKDGSCMTDEEVIRYTYGVTDRNCHDLIYCEDARFIDFGHNDTLTDVSYVASMKKLEAIIISGAPIRDLSAFRNCESLVFLEAAFCHYLEDISPLADCRNLKMLNISYTQVTDLSALDDLPLEKLCAKHHKIPKKERKRAEKQHPDCLILFKGDQPYGYGWRYDDNGYTPTEYYAMLRKVFHYSHPENTRK